MRIRENLNSVTFQQHKIPFLNNKNNNKIGVVYGVVTTENTPTKKQFERAGGFNSIGAVFFKEFSQFNNKDIINDNFLDGCQIAKPYSSNLLIPLIGEVINIISSPSAASTLSNNAEQNYYTEIINVFGNIQHNSISENDLGNTFIEKSNIRNLLPFEGDLLIQGRKGNGIRFGCTTKSLSSLNEWSKIGEDGNPITILTNGYSTDENNLKPHSEKINEDKSSIYLTSNQSIPLIPDRNDELNSFTKPIQTSKYFHSQIIMNSDRITLNSKKDELMLFSKTNIELSTNNIINLNAKKWINFNSPVILLGTDGNKPPTEPLLLGNKTKELLSELIQIITDLGNSLSSVTTPPQGSPLVGVNVAGTELVEKISAVQNKLKNITSTVSYTV